MKECIHPGVFLITTEPLSFVLSVEKAVNTTTTATPVSAEEAAARAIARAKTKFESNNSKIIFLVDLLKPLLGDAKHCTLSHRTIPPAIEDSSRETYSFNFLEYHVRFKIETYGPTSLKTSTVIAPGTARDITKLVRSMQSFDTSYPFSEERSDAFMRLTNLFDRCFTMTCQDLVFQTECEEDEWHIFFSDGRNRCNAELSIIAN